MLHGYRQFWFEKRFDTSNYEVERTPPMAKNKKVIGSVKDELGGKIMIILLPHWWWTCWQESKGHKEVWSNLA